MNSIQPPPGPSAITAQWIASQSKPFEDVELYFQRLYFEAGDHNAQRNMIAAMPRGYRMLFVFWRFYTDVDNGGFGQFIGNASAEDPSQQIIVETVEALSRLGMDELASLCKEAI